MQTVCITIMHAKLGNSLLKLDLLSFVYSFNLDSMQNIARRENGAILSPCPTNLESGYSVIIVWIDFDRCNRL